MTHNKNIKDTEEVLQTLEKELDTTLVENLKNSRDKFEESIEERDTDGGVFNSNSVLDSVKSVKSKAESNIKILKENLTSANILHKDYVVYINKFITDNEVTLKMANAAIAANKPKTSNKKSKAIN